jgi:hypothetical protein
MEWPLIFLGGLLGASHCVGMCGAFAMLVGMNRGSWKSNLVAQLTWSAGRLLTYVTLGSIAGFAGHRIVKSAPAILSIPAALCVIAGVLLIVEGVTAAGLWKRGGVTGRSQAGCLTGPLFSSLLRIPLLRNALAAGMFTGLLPCGLLYAFVALAASSGNWLNGMAVMAVFGLGTVPLLLLTGLGGSLLSVAARQRVLRLAAWCVIATGVLTCVRGGAFFLAALNQEDPEDACPFCVTRNSPD